MKLIIIGNGFDKGHGLKTGYWDFRTYLENLYPEFLASFEEHYYIYPRMDEDSKKKILWNELESNLANIDEDVIIENATSMELGLEGGDIEIEDTLYDYFTEEYKYIQLLAKYINQWIRTIRIKDVRPRTSLINKFDDSFYITFNYTAVLEAVYKVDEQKIIHIHGSLRQRDDAPILGHGNKKIIHDINDKIRKAELEYDDKRSSICKVIKKYYTNTFKDTNRYMSKLLNFSYGEIDEIILIGHSVTGVDIPYFINLDIFTKQNLSWKVYYHEEAEKERILNNLTDCGIDLSRIDMKPSTEFYNL